MSTLPGSDRYRKAEVTKPLRPDDPLVVANNIPVIRVLRDLWSVQVPEGLGHRSWKTYCPLGWEHPDGGVSKGFRVYEQTNTSYCFVMHGSLTPIRLAQIRWGGPQRRAARRLLEVYQLGRRHWRERYQEVLYEREMRERASSSAAYVVEALRMALTAVPGYEERQYEPRVVELVEAELEALDEMMRTNPSDKILRDWYYQTKEQLVSKITEEMKK